MNKHPHLQRSDRSTALGLWLLVVGLVLFGWIGGKVVELRWNLDLEQPIHPFSVFVWAWTYGGEEWRDDEAWVADLGREAGMASLSVVGLAVLGGWIGRLTGGRGIRKGTGLYGTSREATAAELRASKLFADQGVALGYYGETSRRGYVEEALIEGEQHEVHSEKVHREWVQGRDVLRHGGVEAVLFVATTRAGKGQTLLPSILEWQDGPVFVLDPKGGELFQACAGALDERGRKVYRIDPTDGTGSACKWNPLLEIDPEDEVADAQRVASYLFTESLRDGSSAEHFRGRATSGMTGFILHSLFSPDGKKSLADVLRMIAIGSGGAQEFLNQYCASIAESAHDPELGNRWLDEHGNQTATHPSVRLLMSGLAQSDPRELSGIFSTMFDSLSAWVDPSVARATEACEFSFREARRRGGKMAVFLTIPAVDMERLAGFMRVFLYFFERAFGPSPAHVDHAASGRERVLLVMDEFSQMGRCRSIARLLSTGGSAGVVSVLTCQNLSQLRKVYGSSESISGSCPVWWMTAGEDPTLLREVEAKLGPVSVKVREVSRSHGKHSSATVREGEHRRPFLTQGELRTLPSDTALVLGPGVMPVFVKKRLAHEMRDVKPLLGLGLPEFRALYDESCPWGSAR